MSIAKPRSVITCNHGDSSFGLCGSSFGLIETETCSNFPLMSTTKAFFCTVVTRSPTLIVRSSADTRMGLVFPVIGHLSSNPRFPRKVETLEIVWLSSFAGRTNWAFNFMYLSLIKLKVKDGSPCTLKHKLSPFLSWRKKWGSFPTVSPASRAQGYIHTACTFKHRQYDQAWGQILNNTLKVSNTKYKGCITNTNTNTSRSI